MTSRRRGDVGKSNNKVPDSDIQGVKGGQRNRAETESGSIPPPAGESRQARDPRVKPAQARPK